MLAALMNVTSSSVVARSAGDRRLIRRGFAKMIPSKRRAARPGNSQRGWFATRLGKAACKPIATRIAMLTGRRGSPRVARRHAGPS